MTTIFSIAALVCLGFLALCYLIADTDGKPGAIIGKVVGLACVAIPAGVIIGGLIGRLFG